MGMLMSRSRQRRCYKSKDQRQRESATMEKQIEAARLAQQQPEEETSTFEEETPVPKTKKTKKDYRPAHQLKILMSPSKDTEHICTPKELSEIMDQMTHKKYMRSKMWQRKRQQFLDSKEDTCCEVCGVKEANQVHHRTYQRLLIEKMSDLVLLCRECHDVFHKVVPTKKMSKSQSYSGVGHCVCCYKRTSQDTDPGAMFEKRNKKGRGDGKVMCGRCVPIFRGQSLDVLCTKRWSYMGGVWNSPYKKGTVIIRKWTRNKKTIDIERQDGYAYVNQ